jgi:hypothetical protein
LLLQVEGVIQSAANGSREIRKGQIMLGRVSVRIVPLVVCVLTLMAGDSAAVDSTGPKPSVWEPLRFLLGSWAGTGSGQPGVSSVDREYRLVLGDRFVEVRNTSTYAPQERNPKGEVHEDRGLISWDRARKRFMMRQFHVESFVIHYVADSLAASADSVVFTSQSIENIPAGYRARETYRILGPDELVERFEMADPGGEFKLYSESRPKRKPSPTE